MSGALDGGVQDPLQPELVAAQRCNRLLEQVFGAFVPRVYATNVDLFPFDRNVIGLENCLDRLCNFSADSVTCITIPPRLAGQSSRPQVCKENAIGSEMLAWTEDRGHTGDQCNCVFAAVFCGFEDVGLDGGHC